MTVDRLSIVICTYNRAALLRTTLDALGELDPVEQCDIEIVIVDNNSSDNTQQVIGEAAQKSPFPIRGFHEVKQGKSFALNRALKEARGDILALTDDDVNPAHDWAARIVAAFREKPITFVFGKVLPQWAATPPAELLTKRAQDIWGPLAIVDYGDEPAAYLPEATGQRLPVGANLSFSREALITIGGWRTDLGKVNNSLISGEDHEIFMRLRRHGIYSGWYDPALTVRHHVPQGRLTRRYFRRWFYWHGRTQALMLDDLFLNLDMARVPRIAGVPRFLYRQGFQQGKRWMRALGSSDALDVLIEELHTLQFAGLYYGCWKRWLRREACSSTLLSTSSS